MVDKQDLGLSLSLSFPEKHATSSSTSLQLNLLPSVAASPSPLSHLLHQRTFWTNSYPSSDPNPEACRGEARSLLKGIDVNRLPEAADAKEDMFVSSPNSTLSSVSGKRSEREGNGDEHEIERAYYRGISDEEDGESCRKKLRLSRDQSSILEDNFKEHSTLNPKQKVALAKRLGLRPRQVEVWFQNRRARTKSKQTEVDCEYMKKFCDKLTDENRRLQREVQELRALKLSPLFYMPMTPPTTLTMCPSCQRVTVPPPSSSSASSAPPVHVHPRVVPPNQWATGSHALYSPS